MYRDLRAMMVCKIAIREAIPKIVSIKDLISIEN
jgi:hypothetical protein